VRSLWAWLWTVTSAETETATACFKAILLHFPGEAEENQEINFIYLVFISCYPLTSVFVFQVFTVKISTCVSCFLTMLAPVPQNLAMKACEKWGERVRQILNFSARWSGMVIFTLRPPYPGENASGGSKKWSVRDVEEKIRSRKIGKSSLWKFLKFLSSQTLHLLWVTIFPQHVVSSHPESTVLP